MNFYFQASDVLDRLARKQGSIKGLLGGLPEKDRKRTAALVIETLKFKPALTDVIVASKLLKEERKITSMNLALVLVHDLLLSNGIQAGDGPVKQAVLRHKTRLSSEFQRLKIKKGAKSNQGLAQAEDPRAAAIPRYVRVNTLMGTTEDTISTLTSRGFEFSGPFDSTKGFAADSLIPDLLLFSPQTQFHEDPLYKSGKLILQDKASCFPAVVLDPPCSGGAVVLDATAAPGNKTSHLSALMQNKGKLFAFEKDRKRFGTLTKMLSKAGCTNVQSVHADFLSVSPSDEKYGAVTHILLDPSCSGSGIVNRMDYLMESEIESDDTQEERLNKLAAFQLTMIKHAMKFRSVVKIVYSTCSIHAVENEQVVSQALKSDEARAGKFGLASRSQVLPLWHRRGVPTEMDDPTHAECVVRCSPGEDGTNGFFVACFVKEAGNNDLKRKRDSFVPPENHEQNSGVGKRKRKNKKV
ncbi:hypothetical protein JAAARDRAFT_35863 [Jaapia argillacea MUCL 33604]|uniref:SAM-dependent MTase RsmB/NOP-type domain-containing protein n=1 Tax=Jaapia argillacea MUCL 33604 TaxID=933084 RepID=A0A067PR53_9AGAM|nr:hypothetical protein JAAARDRAFT_35863 [Jaapia argillacea MUCL 33604]